MNKKNTIIITNSIEIVLSFIIFFICKFEWSKFYLLFAFWFALKIVGILFMGVCVMFVNRNKEYSTRNPLIHFFVETCMKSIIEYSGIFIIPSGLDKIDFSHKAVYVFNHTSQFDPILMNVVLPKAELVHMSKPENGKIPIAGKGLYRDCYLFFKRNDLKFNAKEIIRGSKFLEDDKFSVGIAPEGTRNKKDPSHLLPFNEGVFKLALRSKRDIVVLEIRNTENAHKNFPFKRTNVEFNCLEVLKYNDYKDLDTMDISSRVRNIIQTKIDNRK